MKGDNCQTHVCLILVPSDRKVFTTHSPSAKSHSEKGAYSNTIGTFAIHTEYTTQLNTCHQPFICYSPVITAAAIDLPFKDFLIFLLIMALSAAEVNGCGKTDCPALR